jgi:hypothetical protein
MSRTEHIKGKIRRLPLSEGETVETQAKDLLDKYYPDVELDDPESYKYSHQLMDEGYNRFVITNNFIYEIIESVEMDDDGDFIELGQNDDGTINFHTQFYNGGTCLSEVLVDELEKTIENDERN